MNPNDAKNQLNNQVSQLNSALANLNKARGTNFKGVSQLTEPIKADQLGKVQPYNVPPINNVSTTGNLAQTTNQYQSQIQTAANAEPILPVNQNKTKLNSYLEGIMGNISGQADAVNAINKEEDVANKKAQALALSGDLDMFDKDYRDDVKAIKENPLGKTTAGLQDDLNRAQERYEDVRANKVLSYNSALNDYQGASEIATSKIQALKDQNSQALQAYSLFADSVMNDLTESEKLQVQANLQQKQLQAKTVEDAYSQALQAGMDNKASQAYYNALDNAKKTGNVASILGTVSQYGYQTLDQQVQRSSLAVDNAQLSKIYQEINDANSNVVSNGGLIPDKVLTKSTEGEKKGYGFLNRAINAQSVIDELETSPTEGGKGYKKSGILTNLYNKIAGTNVIGLLPGSAELRPGKALGLQTQNYESYNQAAEDFIYAVLRLESGATIPPDEMANYKRTYFPVTGESKATVKQKQVSREKAIGFLKSTAGNLAPYAEQNQFQEYSNLLKSASPAQLKELGITK